MRSNLRNRHFKLKKKRYSQNECKFHDCAEPGILSCSFCKEKFCQRHSTPTLVLTRYRIDTAPPHLKYGYEQEYRKNGHPCNIYDTVWHEKEGRLTLPVRTTGEPRRCDYCKALFPLENFAVCRLCHRLYCVFHKEPEKHECQLFDENNKPHIALENSKGDSETLRECDYCKSTPTAEFGLFFCNGCGKKLCLYHREPKEHHCPQVDWGGLKRKEWDASEKLVRDRDARISRNASILLAVVVFISILALIGLYLLSGEYFKSCDDGTFSNLCSANKPFLCRNGEYIYDANTCGCPNAQIIDNNVCRNLRNCSDGTPTSTCSDNQPFFCNDGVLFPSASLCDCPNFTIRENDSCRLEINCFDGTRDTVCSVNKPLLCYNGTLIEKATSCGCSDNSMLNGDKCDNLELMVHDLINSERLSNGLATLEFDEEIASIARAHSQDMGENNFFSHNNLIGQDPSSRAKAAGYSCYKNFGSYYVTGLGENIFQTYTYGTIWYTNGVETGRDYLTSSQLAHQIVTGWMNSPGHRENILSSTYDREGIGVFITQTGEVLVTEDFC